MKIVFPESENPIVKAATEPLRDIEILPASNLADATNLILDKKADSMISGLDYPSRDVLLAYKKNLPLQSKYFSSCFVCKKENQIIIIADGGVNKKPNKDQLYTIIEDTATTFKKCFNKAPKIALLSYSTKGSGGKNDDQEKNTFVINEIQKNHPDWIIDGEMQLDAAINPQIAQKKIPNSPLKGDANILITPDLNSGNILYKSLEQFGGFTVAGPIIQGFKMPLADLSRGSSQKDITYTIEIIQKLF